MTTRQKKVYVSLAIFFLVFLFPAVPVATFSRVSGSNMLQQHTSSSRDYTCNTNKTVSVVLRDRCGFDFLTVLEKPGSGKSIVAVSNREWESAFPPEAEIVKESCQKASSTIRLTAPLYTRLYHPHSDKYICFSRRGRVRTVARNHVNGRGKLCMFNEDPVGNGSPIVQYSSAYKSQWVLGFYGPKRRSLQGFRLPRPGKVRAKNNKCFYFSVKKFEHSQSSSGAVWALPKHIEAASLDLLRQKEAKMLLNEPAVAHPRHKGDSASRRKRRRRRKKKKKRRKQLSKFASSSQWSSSNVSGRHFPAKKISSSSAMSHSSLLLQSSPKKQKKQAAAPRKRYFTRAMRKHSQLTHEESSTGHTRQQRQARSS